MKKQEKYLSRRILACIIDYSLILIYTSVHFYLFGVLNEEGGYSLNGLPAFSVFIFWFIMTIGMEQLLGATIGNLINNSIKKIINKTVKKVKFDSDKIDVKNSTPSIKFNSNNSIEKLKINSIGLINSSLKIIQFPIRVISLFVIIISGSVMFAFSN